MCLLQCTSTKIASVIVIFPISCVFFLQNNKQKNGGHTLKNRNYSFVGVCVCGWVSYKWHNDCDTIDLVTVKVIYSNIELLYSIYINIKYDGLFASETISNFVFL